MTEEESKESAKEPSSELDEMAKKYSKKWGVPIEEAKKSLKGFLDRKPTDRTKLTPTGELPFPEPVGPLSLKVQDMNQAALSTAMTAQKLKELGQPPEEFKSLREKVEYIEKTIEGTLNLVTTTMKDMQTTLAEKQKKEEKQELIAEFQGILGPLKEKVEALEKVKEGTASPETKAEITVDKVLATGEQVTEQAKNWLERMGYKIEIPKGLSVTEVEAKIKEAIEASKKSWEKETGAQVQVETERIRATENILNTAIDRVFDVFLEPVKNKIQEAIEKGAFKAPGA